MLEVFLLLNSSLSLVQMFFPLGPVSHAIYGGVACFFVVDNSPICLWS
jgi:hypothetical protein